MRTAIRYASNRYKVIHVQYMCNTCICTPGAPWVANTFRFVWNTRQYTDDDVYCCLRCPAHRGSRPAGPPRRWNLHPHRAARQATASLCCHRSSSCWTGRLRGAQRVGAAAVPPRSASASNSVSACIDVYCMRIVHVLLVYIRLRELRRLS